MHQPLVSVIVPVYNVADYLEECLDSILAQTYAHYEVVAVNDGSTDASLEILKRYATKDGRVRVVDQPNGGLAAARNTGVACAQGDYFVFVDSDDYVMPTYLEKMYEDCMRESADVSICGRYNLLATGLVHQRRAGFSGMVLDAAVAVRALNSYRSFDMSMCGKLFRACLFDGIAFPEGKNSEDQFVCYKLLLRARRVYYEDEPLYVYRHRAGSISRGSRVNAFPIEASHEQLADLRDARPELVYAGETSCFFSQVAVYNAFALRGLEPSAEVAAVLDVEPRLYLPSVLRNPDLPLKKKLQALLFRYGRSLYKRVFVAQRG